MAVTITLIIVLSLLCASVANSTPLDTVRTVHEFPKGTFVENLAVRSNGQMVVTTLTSPHLFLFNSVQFGPPALIHNFTSALALSGIAEYAPDTFAVLTGNFSLASGDVGPGSWAVWSVDLRGVKSQPDKTLYPPPKICKIADIPEGRFLNGMSLLSPKDGTLLIGDATAGNIIRLDAKTGNYKVVIDNFFTAAVPQPLPYPPAGVNGLHVRDGFVFLTNTGRSIFGKIPINGDGTPAGNGSVIAHTLGPEDGTKNRTPCSSFTCSKSIPERNEGSRQQKVLSVGPPAYQRVRREVSPAAGSQIIVDRFFSYDGKVRIDSSCRA
ncbi:unnamed protein product [Calypogeia fissa]